MFVCFMVFASVGKFDAKCYAQRTGVHESSCGSTACTIFLPEERVDTYSYKEIRSTDRLALSCPVQLALLR